MFTSTSVRHIFHSGGTYGNGEVCKRRFYVWDLDELRDYYIAVDMGVMLRYFLKDNNKGVLSK